MALRASASHTQRHTWSVQCRHALELAISYMICVLFEVKKTSTRAVSSNEVCDQLDCPFSHVINNFAVVNKHDSFIMCCINQSPIVLVAPTQLTCRVDLSLLDFLMCIEKFL